MNIEVLFKYVVNPSNTLEISMATCFVIASYLIANQNQNAFWFWLLANILGLFFFYNNSNYSMFLLSIYGVFTSLYGLWNFKIRNKKLN